MSYTRICITNDILVNWFYSNDRMWLQFYYMTYFSMTLFVCTASYTKVVSKKKEYEIIGLFPVGITDVIDSEVLLWSQAFVCYVEKYNQLYADLFYYRLYDLPTRENYPELTNISLDIISENSYEDSNNVTSCTCASKNYPLYKTVGAVGAASSANTEYISKVVRYENLMLISYTSTSEVLSNKNEFPNVYRTIPPDSFQVKAMQSLLSIFNWTYVSLIYEDTSYGYSGFDAIKKSGLCLSLESSVLSDFSNLNKTFTQLRNDPKANVIILYGSFNLARMVLEKAQKENLKNKIWIISDASGRKPWFIEFKKQFPAKLFHIIPTAGLDKEFERFILSHNYSTTDNWPWLRKYFHTKGIKEPSNPTQLKEFKSEFDFSQIGFVRNAVSAYVESVIQFLYNNCPFANLNLEICSFPIGSYIHEFIDILKNITFTGLLGEDVKFDGNGDVKSATFDIYTVENNQDSYPGYMKFASWNSKQLENISKVVMEKYSRFESKCSNTCPPGFENTTHSDTFCCWFCVKCSQYQFKSTAGNHKCENCEQGTLPSQDHTKCIPIMRIFLNENNYGGKIIIAFSAISIFLVLFLLFVVIAKRKTPVVRASNFKLSILQLLAHLAIFILANLFIQEDTITKCQVRTYGITFCYIIIITIVLTKISHLVTIFSLNYRLTKWEIIQQQTTELLIIVVCMVIHIIIAVIVHETNPLRIETINTKDFKEYDICLTENTYVAHIVYVLILQILCGIQSFRGRNIPEKYNEAKYVSFAMFISTVLLIVAIIAANNVDSYNDSLLLQACLLMGSNLTIMLSLYGYKILIVIYRPEENTVEVFRKNRFGSFSSMQNFKLNAVVKVSPKTSSKLNLTPVAANISDMAYLNPCYQRDSIDIPDKHQTAIPKRINQVNFVNHEDSLSSNYSSRRNSVESDEVVMMRIHRDRSSIGGNERSGDSENCDRRQNTKYDIDKKSFSEKDQQQWAITLETPSESYL